MKRPAFDFEQFDLRPVGAAYLLHPFRDLISTPAFISA